MLAYRMWSLRRMPVLPPQRQRTEAPSSEPGMSLCPSCGLDTPDGFCSHHATDSGDAWAISNRIMCDLIHRGVAPMRLSTHDRDDNFWGVSPTDG